MEIEYKTEIETMQGEETMVQVIITYEFCPSNEINDPQQFKPLVQEIKEIRFIIDDNSKMECVLDKEYYPFVEKQLDGKRVYDHLYHTWLHDDGDYDPPPDYPRCYTMRKENV